MEGWSESSFTHEGDTKVVYRRGTGPGVVVMHEMPGITPEAVTFAQRVVDAGFTVLMPHLFGTVGKKMSSLYVTSEIARACVRREFRVLAANESSPITHWLRALCRSLHAELGGRGVGAIGMCFTGNFALALMVDESVMAPVLSQPSLPFPLTPKLRAGLHVSDEELVVIKRRAREGVKLLGLRFTNDPACPKVRFDHLRRELGEAFEAIEIDSSSGNPHGIARSAHSVVTFDLVDRPGHPTRRALDRVLSFFAQNLREPSPPPSVRRS